MANYEIRWRIRQVMAQRDMFQTTDLIQPLRERGILLSREQIYRLVTRPPQRLSVDVLAALCGALECTPNDLMELVPVATGSAAAPAAAQKATGTIGALRPIRAQVKRPGEP